MFSSAPTPSCSTTCIPSAPFLLSPPRGSESSAPPRFLLAREGRSDLTVPQLPRRRVRDPLLAPDGGPQAHRADVPDRRHVLLPARRPLRRAGAARAAHARRGSLPVGDL